jgi:tetratricopeptide (TPR) repeat protein
VNGTRVGIAALLIGSALAMTACDDSASLERKYIKRGETLLDQGDATRARLEFLNAVRLAPVDAAPYFWLGRSDEAAGNLRDAFLSYRQAVQQDAHYYPALLKLARMYLAGGQLEEVEARVATVLAGEPNNSEAHAIKAAVLLRRKDFDECEKEARVALADDPNSTAPASVLVGLYSAKHDLGQATKALDDVIARHPDDLSLLVLQVQLYRQFDQIDRVSAAYQAILKITPKDAATRSEAANYYVDVGRLDLAEAVLRDGVKAAPDDFQMKRLLVTFLRDHRTLDVTESTIRTFMAADPSNDGYYFMLADAYLKNNSADRAEALLNQLIENKGVETSGLNARTSLAQLNYSRGNQALAEKLLEVVLTSKPTDPQALMTQASIAFNEGRFQTVVANTRSVLRQYPRSPNALRLLSEALLRQGHVDLAADTMSQLVQAQPLDLGPQLRLAELYQLRGDSQQALKIMEGINKLFPDNAAGLEVAARIANENKAWTVADAAISRLETIPAENEPAIFLRAQYFAARGELQAAVEKLDGLISSDPSSQPSTEGVTLLLAVETKQGQIDAAARFLESLKSELPTVRTALALCYVALKRPTDAAREFDFAISKGGGTPERILGRADLYLAEGKFGEAEALLKGGVEATPGDVRVAFQLAVVEAGEGKYREAGAVYEDLLARDPGLDAAANNLAELTANHNYGDAAAMEKARGYADRFQASSDPGLLDTVGWVYYRLGQYSKASVYLERALARPDVPAEVHYHYGALLLQLGQKEKAKAQLEQAAHAGSGFAWGDEAKKMLETI